MDELNLLNFDTIENKIINFYTMNDVLLKFVKKTDTYSVTRYFFKIKNNAKIRKIENNIKELELFLQNSSVKLDLDKENGNIILELTKKEKQTLYFEDLKNDITEGLTATIGKDINNNEINLNIEKLPHLLIAGSTGSGKSCLLNSLILSLFQKYDKDYIKSILIDLKQVEFLAYNNNKHLATPVITTTEKAIDILSKMLTIMTSRYNYFSKKEYRNIQEHNQNENDKICYYLIVIDELADLLIQAPEIENLICRLAQLGRAAGIHLILCTQRPDAKTLSGKIKVNIPARIALTVTNSYDSKTILDSTGAEKLTGNGDFLFKNNTGIITRGQSAFIDNIKKYL